MVFLKAFLISAGLALFVIGFLILPGCTGTGIPFLFFGFAIYLVGAGLAVPPGGAWQLGLGAAIFGSTILVIGFLIGFGVTSCLS